MPKPKVFISYSHEDALWLERLREHLDVLDREGLLELWDDQRIVAGGNWESEIAAAIEAANVAVLLVSSKFLNSKFIRDKELPRLLERRKTAGLHVFPVILKACLWDQVHEISTIQARPRAGKTLAASRGDSRERELVAIAKEIFELTQLTNGGAPEIPVNHRTSDAAGYQSPIIPRHLPSPPGDFVGREEELAVFERWIRECATKGELAIVALFGMGGLGKTALAEVLAQRVVDLYQGGQVVMDLGGKDRKPPASEEIMYAVIRAFKPGALREDDKKGELPGKYRTELSGQRVLLFFDNVVDDRQVAPLIPPPGNLLLLTSRTVFHLPGMRWKTLDALSNEEAKRLLTGIAPRIDPEAEAIASLCGNLPFALRLAAKQMGEQAGLSPPALRKKLQRAENQEDWAENALGVTYRLLTSRHRDGFRLLAVFPGAFDAEAAAFVGARSAETAESHLGELTRRCLVEAKDGRYWLHDLARAFVANRLAKDELERISIRHAEYYLGVLRRLREIYLRDAAGVLESLAGFDQEWPNIRAAWDFAERSVGQSDLIDQICTDLPRVAGYLLDIRLSSREHLRWLQTALQVATRLGREENVSHHLNSIGLCHADLGQYSEAIEAYKQRIDLAERIGDLVGMANAYGNLVSVLAVVDRRSEAIRYYREDIRLARTLGNSRGLANALGGLGLNYLALNRFSRGMGLCKMSLAIKRDIGDQRGEANLLGGLATAYVQSQKHDQAIECFERQLTILRAMALREDEAASSWSLGQVYEAVGRLEEASRSMQVEVDYLREVGEPGAWEKAAYVDTLRARIRQPRRREEFVD